MQIGKFEVKFHWSLLIIIALVLSQFLTLFANPLHGLLAGLMTIFTVYSIVLLHEMAHMKAAHWLGHTGAKKIMLFALGGLAQIPALGDFSPKEEFIISIAGPLSNFVMAGGAFLLAYVLGIDVFLTDNLLTLYLPMALSSFFYYNMLLGIFNLIPAFPMDGGRILRAALSVFMPRLKATKIATVIAWAWASVFILYGAMNGMIVLAIIGGFVAFVSYQELQAAKRGMRIEYE